MAVSAPRSILEPAGPLVRRQRVDRLSLRQVAALRKAFAAVQSDGTYRELAQLYSTHARRGTWSFLPWNRAYLRAFEVALLDRVPRAALPWWDWSQQHEYPRAFYSLTEDTEPNSLELIDLPEEGRIQRGRVKATPPALPTPSDVRAVLALDDFADFSSRVEELHNLVHVWAGHPLDHVRTAAYDPLFWPLEAMADRIWRMWQQRHPKVGLSPEFLEQPLEPFGVRVVDVLDPRTIGYDYADLPRRRVKEVPGPEAAEVEDWRPVLPGYRSDEVPAVPVDHLGIEPEVEALCWVIAARETRPPALRRSVRRLGLGQDNVHGAHACPHRGARRGSPPAP